jgi:hypothetical protein
MREIGHALGPKARKKQELEGHLEEGLWGSQQSN